MPTVSTGTLTSVAGAVSSWFSGAHGVGLGALSSISLTGIKLNRIGTNGRYVDPVTMEHTYPTPILGTGTGTAAPQLTVVATLATALERGRASKGRMYLPPTQANATITADGRMNTTNTEYVTQSVKALIAAINSIYTAIGRVGVASDAGSGRFEHVTKVRGGKVVDTMRSRRSSFPEDYYEINV